MVLEERLGALKAELAELDRSLRELEQESKIVTQHVEASIGASRTGGNKMQ
jgi:hypothetical protein